MNAKIAEIFKSIQGEGVYQGVPQVFVRFFGCNLGCSFCDTPLDSYQQMSVDEVIDKIASFGDCHSVSLTGGEPLLQAEFSSVLCRRLKQQGYKIYLETNGVLAQALPALIDYLDIIAMDFKLPTSTGLGDFWERHEQFLRACSPKDVFIKAVVGRDTQVIDILKAIEVINTVHPRARFVLQPESPYEDELVRKLELFKAVAKLHGLTVKVIAQAHKKLGVK